MACVQGCNERGSETQVGLNFSVKILLISRSNHQSTKVKAEEKPPTNMDYDLDSVTSNSE